MHVTTTWLVAGQQESLIIKLAQQAYVVRSKVAKCTSSDKWWPCSTLVMHNVVMWPYASHIYDIRGLIIHRPGQNKPKMCETPAGQDEMNLNKITIT
jgi:hypothetical protein